MAKSQQLTTIVAINAKVGSGFNEVGATLTELGTIVNGISQKLIDFGKDSINVYRDYEKSMKDAEVALSTSYGRGTRELATVMSDLDSYANQWAAESIFHTNDVANAISEAAHAGWDFDQIIGGIPAAMELARAGSLDLSDAVNYIVKSSNALGLGLEGDSDSMEHFIDIWAYAANSSASTIEEFGDAMLRMGSTMRFASNPEELMTLIAVTANAGQVGSEAGTLIRNSMMRLIAPTQKASDAMELLGATDEDIAELSGDAEKLAQANAILAENGFSAYDDNGDLKSVLDIYRELYLATQGMTEEEKNGIIGAIFPTRTITEAMTLLRGAAEEYGGLYEKLMGGSAAGYGTYASETMSDTLDSRIEIFLSKVERLQELVGGSLSDDLSSVMDFLGGVVDDLANMDSGKLDALVSGLSVIATAGPGLLLAGGAMRLLGFLLTPAGGVGLGLLALTSAAVAIKELNDADIASAFGTNTLDGAEISRYLAVLQEDFKAAYGEVDKFSTALDTAVTNYTTASSTFTSDLLSDMLTATTLSDDDIKKYETLGKTMYDSLIAGIKAETSENVAFWAAIFGGEEEAKDNEAFQIIAGAESAAYNDAIAQAEQVGKNLREAMNKAFEDGQISPDEYQNIVKYIEDYNRAIAEATAEAQRKEDFIQREMLFKKAQTASLDELREMESDVVSQRDTQLSALDEEFNRRMFGLQYDYENGYYSDEQYASVTDAARARYIAERRARAAAYDDILYNARDSQLRQSDFGDAYTYLEELAGQMLTSQITGQGATSAFRRAFGGLFGVGGQAGELRDLLNEQVDLFGGVAGLRNRISYYESLGDESHVNNLLNLLTMSQIASSWDNGVHENYGPSGEAARPNMYSTNGAAAGTQQFVMQYATQAPEPPEPSWTSKVQELESQGVEVTIDGDVTELQATLDGTTAEPLLQYIDGDATGLEMAIYEQDGKTLLEYVQGDTSALASAINQYQNRIVRVRIQGYNVLGGPYAEGGRAVVPSVFGEAGPEWAIPEEHSTRTAELLNAARAASGFTWQEIISRFGGLNANTNSSGNTLVYSPVINATDVSGVKKVLEDDKNRLAKWLAEQKMRDSLEVYA